MAIQVLPAAARPFPPLPAPPDLQIPSEGIGFPNPLPVLGPRRYADFPAEAPKSDTPRMQMQIADIMVSSTDALVSQLGQSTTVENGLVKFNEPLIQSICAQREAAIPALAKFFKEDHEPLAVVEGLYAAQRLAERTIKGVETLYAPASRYNTSDDPLIQTYLAGFYRKLNEPAAFGPMLATLINQSVYRYPNQGRENVTEEVGGTILQKIAEQSARETVKLLMPYLGQLPAQSQKDMPVVVPVNTLAGRQFETFA